MDSIACWIRIIYTWLWNGNGNKTLALRAFIRYLLRTYTFTRWCGLPKGSQTIQWKSLMKEQKHEIIFRFKLPDCYLDNFGLKILRHHLWISHDPVLMLMFTFSWIQIYGNSSTKWVVALFTDPFQSSARGFALVVKTKWNHFNFYRSAMDQLN